MLHQLLGHLARGAQLPRQPEGGGAVGNGEVDDLRHAPHLARHLLRRHAEDAAGGGGVQVLAAAEDLDQRLVAGDVRQHAQLDLRVVRRQQHASPARRG